MKQLRPRSLTIYTKFPDEVHETFLAKQNHEEFIKTLQEFKQQSDNISVSTNVTNGSFNLSADKKPKFKGDKKKFPSEPFHKSEKQRTSGFLSGGFSLKNLLGRSSTTSTPQEIKPYSPPIGENVYFSDKAFLTAEFGKDRHLKQPEPILPMNIATFLGQYVTQDDLNHLELRDMTDIDNEKLEELKEKSVEFIDATSHMMLKQEESGDLDANQEELVMFFNEKLQELRANDINIQIFIQNLQHVTGISYEKNGARIYFKK